MGKVGDDASISMLSGSPHEYNPMGRGSGISNRTSNRSSGGSLTIETANNMYGSYGVAGMNANQFRDDDSINSDSISTASRSPYPSFHEQGRNSGANSIRQHAAGSGNNLNISNISANNVEENNIIDLQTVTRNAVNVAVPSLRFDRVGALRWNSTNTFLYDFDALQHSTHRTSFYLVDEMKLKNFLVELMSQSNQLLPGYAESLNQGVFQLSLSYMQAASGLSSIEKVRTLFFSSNKCFFNNIICFLNRFYSNLEVL